MEELASLICREGYNFSAATGGPVAGPEEAAQSFQVARELLRRAFLPQRDSDQRRSLRYVVSWSGGGVHRRRAGCGEPPNACC